MMKIRTPSYDLPEPVADAVGPERAELAGARARDAVARLDRDNHWAQEPAHVFRPAMQVSDQ